MNPKYFGDMPILAVSLIGIVCGILVGVLTVLLASMSPCRKASGVSPVSAVNGMNKEAAPVEMKVKTAGLPVEVALGISHAAAVKKNLLLMMGSFAISIILFLSFSIMIEFMFNAITTLKPWTPDLSVVSEDNSLSISTEVLKELDDIPEIDKSYGRMFAYDLKGSCNGGAMAADLISYEQNQFRWAKDYVIDGSTEPAETVPGQVLVEYDASVKWRVGDKIILVINGKEEELTIAGFLSSTPFHSNDGNHLMICSEETFTKLIGGGYYTIIDMKLSKNATEDTIKEIRRISGDGIKLSDRRESNTSSRAVFYSLAIFVYGFLFVIASITVFNIINSMNMSISSRIRRYGVMRAIGMSGKQVKRMIIAEAATYSVCGCIIGTVLGLLINKSLYELAITSRWGYQWEIPVNYLLIILLIVVLSTMISVIGPTKKVRDMEIITSINCL
jgi:putative ABC transport system permease protein